MTTLHEQIERLRKDFNKALKLSETNMPHMGCPDVSLKPEYAIKLLGALEVLANQLDESDRVIEAAVGDIKYGEIKENDCLGMLKRCSIANKQALAQAQKIMETKENER